VAGDTSASDVGIPAVTDACAQRWSEHTGLDRAALDQCIADPHREVLERPPRWSGLTPSPEQRFLVAGGGEAVFVLVASEAPGQEYTAISCVIRNRNELARQLPPPPARSLLMPVAIAAGVVAVVALVGVGVYALLGSEGGNSTPSAPPRPAKELIAASFAAQRSLHGLKLGRARAVHHRHGSVPREVCAPVRRGRRRAGHFCVEVSGGHAVSSWYVPRGRPDRARFRRLCMGQAVAQKRCPAPAKR
jgi:hypothetical protein